MSGDDYAMLSKARLFESLTGGSAEGTTVLTPNRRLAQARPRGMVRAMLGRLHPLQVVSSQ